MIKFTNKKLFLVTKIRIICLPNCCQNNDHFIYIFSLFVSCFLSYLKEGRWVIYTRKFDIGGVRPLSWVYHLIEILCDIEYSLRIQLLLHKF